MHYEQEYAKRKEVKKIKKLLRTYLTFHIFVSRSTSCLPDISIASTLKTEKQYRKLSI